MPSEPSPLDQARVELSVLEALLADGGVPEGCSGAVLRAWSAIAAVLGPGLGGVEGGAQAAPDGSSTHLPSAVLGHLAATLGPASATAIDADLVVIAAHPYHRLERKSLDHHRLALRRLVREATRQVPAGRNPLRRRVLLGALFLAGAVIAGNRIIHPPRWRAAYFPNPDLQGAPRVQQDRAIDFQWTARRPRWDLFPLNFSVRWDSCLQLDARRTVDLTLESDDGSRLFLDGEQVIDLWTDHTLEERTAERTLLPGLHSVRVEYYQKGGGAEVRLHLREATPPGSSWEPAFRLPREPFDPTAPCR